MATPTAVFPAAVATDAQLKVANNQISTALKVSAAVGDTILFVNSAAGFVPNCLVSIDQEIIAVAAVAAGPNPALTVAPGGRGFDGTSAAPHSPNAQVLMLIDAWHHNVVAAEVKAIQSFLGPNGQNIANISGNNVWSQSYKFSQQPGGNLVPGNNSITLAPVPPGVNGSDQNHWLYVSGGTGTAEAVKITGGSAVAGAPSGQLIIQCANNHSGAWTISSASDGIMEAIIAGGSQGVVNLPLGVSNLYATLVVPTTVSLRGQSTTTDLGVSKNTGLVCAAGVSPGIAVADGGGTAAGQGIGVHSGYHLQGQGSTSGLWIGGDPNGIFCPAGWTGSYTRYVNIVVSGFSNALTLQGGNFVAFYSCDFNGNTRALLVPASNAGEIQPVGFYDCLLTVPAGAAVQMDSSGSVTASMFFCGGQVSGTITGASVDWQSVGTHYEPNELNAPIVDISGTQSGIVKITGGLMATHGSSTPYQIRMNAGYVVLFMRDVSASCPTGTTVPTMVDFGSSVGGMLTLENIFNLAAGTFTTFYQLSGAALTSLLLSIRLNQYTAVQNVAAAAALAFPPGNYPNRGVLQISGATLGGSGITSVSGLLYGQSGVLVTFSPQTFTAGATIGSTLTTVPLVPYNYYFDSIKLQIG